MRRMMLVLVLFLCSPAWAVTLYTPPLDAMPLSGAVVWCEAVNVTQSPETITVSVISQYGDVEASFTCPTTPEATGCAAYFAPDDGSFFFCKFDSSASNKGALRAAGKVRKLDLATGAYGSAEQAVPAE